MSICRNTLLNTCLLAGGLFFIPPVYAEAPAGGPPPAAVVVQTLQPRDIPVTYEYVGQVAGSREVEIRARVTGVVEEKRYLEGSQVEAGAELFRIEPSVYEVQLAQAEAELASARASLSKADREYKRVKPLLGRNLVSQDQVDDAMSSLELAQAGVKVAEARVKSSRIDLGYTRVLAPIGGVVGRALIMEGGLADANGNSLLTTMAQLDPVYVNFGVGEQERLERQRSLADGTLKLPDSGWQVSLSDSRGRDLGMSGALDFQDYKVDARNGNFAMRATVANPDHLIAPGQFVRVRLNGGVRPQAMVVPQRAVMDNPEGKFVYIATRTGEGEAIVAMPRPVEVGEWVTLDGEANTNGWIIRSGLKAGDEVVVDGMARIFFPGMPIVPAQPPSPDALGTAPAPAK